MSVDIGERAELICQADGNPSAEITWRRQNKYDILHTSSTYVIPSVRDGMFGVYTCTATVLGFHEIRRDIYVTQNGGVDCLGYDCSFLVEKTCNVDLK